MTSDLDKLLFFLKKSNLHAHADFVNNIIKESLDPSDRSVSIPSGGSNFIGKMYDTFKDLTCDPDYSNKIKSGIEMFDPKRFIDAIKEGIDDGFFYNDNKKFLEKLESMYYSVLRSDNSLDVSNGFRFFIKQIKDHVFRVVISVKISGNNEKWESSIVTLEVENHHVSSLLLNIGMLTPEDGEGC